VRRGYVTLFLWLVWGVGAYAQPLPSVLLLERSGLRPNLCSALRIQLSGTAQVSCESEVREAALTDRISTTAARAKEQGIRLGIFLERDPDPALVRMYLVGSRGDQAVLAVEKIEDRPDHDVDRSLALKVGASLELVTRLETEAAQAGAKPGQQAALAGVLAETHATGSTAPGDQKDAERGTSSWALFLDVGGGVSTGPQAQGLVSASLGAARVRPSWRLDLGLGFELGTRYQESQGLAEVRASERGPLLTARVLQRLGRFEWGGQVLAACSFLSAEGIAMDGTRGDKLLLVPTLGLGLELRVRLFSSAYLRLSPRLDVPLIDRSLSVDRVTVIDYPALRVTVPLSLIFYLPLSARGN
jgi:hypothetical protein